MRSVWDADARAELAERVDRLTPRSERHWGRMDCAQMLVHVVDALRMTFGDLYVTPRNLPLRYTPIKQIVIYWLPFPKNAPTAPELVARRPDVWDDDREAFLALIDRFGRERITRHWPDHPAFGRLSGKQWGVLAYRHTDHHFKQFGA